jgi:hypothetical protein
MWRRAAVAFLVSPAVGAAVAWGVATILWRQASLGFFIATATVAYIIALMVGVPAFLLSRSWMRRAIWAYTLTGAVVAAIPVIPIAYFLTPSAVFLSILTGVVAGATFGVITMPTSNNRWRGP